MVGIERVTMFRGVLMQSALVKAGSPASELTTNFSANYRHLGISAADFGKSMHYYSTNIDNGRDDSRGRKKVQGRINKGQVLTRRHHDSDTF
jgi:hypothetical protein